MALGLTRLMDGLTRQLAFTALLASVSLMTHADQSDKSDTHDHDQMMRALLGGYTMRREASGTSWQPDSTPMSGRHFSMGDWTGMMHGYATAIYTDQAGARGDSDTFISSMLMLMGKREFESGTLGVRAMMSLDPLLIGKRGYPLLFQTGETADGRSPLVDRQHPHDLFMELAGSYSWKFNDLNSAFLYAGLPGEPALGPPTFMHRFSGADNPEAPLLHHWLDSTHVTFGVATLGYIRNSSKFEVSVFNGREPDENRYDIELRELDSWSARLSQNIGEQWSLQASYGRLKSPEGLEPDFRVDRLTLSVTYNQSLVIGNWQSTLAWGKNEHQPGRTTHGYLLETAIVWRNAHTMFARAESSQKDELFEAGEPLSGQVFTVKKVSAGYVRDFIVERGLRVGVGIMGSRHFISKELGTEYGDDPTSYSIFVRLKL